MGVTDNLFVRKSQGANAPELNNKHVSQQFRLHNGNRKNKSVFFEDKLNTTATRYIVDDDGKISSAPHPKTKLTLLDFEGQGYPACICARKASYVRCKNAICQWSGIGRVRTQCKYHPTVTFLLDLPQCPRCLGPIREILRLDDCPDIDSSSHDDDL